MTTLFCKETPGLKLGPGLVGSDNVITFVKGYAELAEDDPRYAEKLAWITGPGCPKVYVLGPDSCYVCGASKIGTGAKAALHYANHRWDEE